MPPSTSQVNIIGMNIIRPECPIVEKNCFFLVLMLLNGVHLEILTHINYSDI